jgi:hypothetical protein
LVASCSDLVASNCLAMTARTPKNKANPLNLELCVSPLLRFLTPAVNTRNDVLIPTGVRSQNHSIRPVAFGEALPAGTRLTLFSDDKPDRFFTVIKFWMDETSGVALALKTGVPTYEGRRRGRQNSPAD